MGNKKTFTGGEFLIREIEAQDIFIPEEFDEEQKMILQSCEDFLETEIFTILDRIDDKEEGLMRELLTKAGELGLLAISIPEEFDGYGQSFVTTMLVNEAMGAGYSFAVAFAAHTGIGTQPILYYGNEEQKRKYIPKLATGELLAAYCLTEPNAGSDANSAKTRAVLSDDGKYYILNGQKMWTTNGGFADIQTVFAKIENDRVLSAFIVERDFPGITLNPEEKKMGIKGSSTVQIFYNDVKVPVENLLGERGGGFRIALNILHMGRIKLGGAILGAAKRAISKSVNYANERKQFDTQIANFGAIKFKLAEQVIKTFTTESAVYRSSQNIDDAIQMLINEGMEKDRATIEGISKYAIETAILKVFSSEALDYIVDETVQIFGGMGFSSETGVERAYRDARINRIFEGTNEINRILVVDTTFKRAMKGEFDLFGQAQAVAKELGKLPENKEDNEDYYEEKRRYIKNFKKAILTLINAVSEKFQRKLVFEQEISFNISDMIMQLYIAESTLLRVEKSEGMKGKEAINIYKDILDVFVYDSANLINKAGIDAVNSFAEGKELQALLKGMQYFTKVAGVNVKEARRRIADKLIDDNRYNF